MRIVAPTRDILDKTLEELVELGCYQAQIIDATLKPAIEDRVAPDDFWSTTNHRTYVRVGGEWVEVAKQRMDAIVIVREEGAAPLAECRKLRDLKKGEMVVCGANGVRIQPEFKGATGSASHPWPTRFHPSAAPRPPSARSPR